MPLKFYIVLCLSNKTVTKLNDFSFLFAGAKIRDVARPDFSICPRREFTSRSWMKFALSLTCLI